jgi:hypothetical protein
MNLEAHFQGTVGRGMEKRFGNRPIPTVAVNQIGRGSVRIQCFEGVPTPREADWSTAALTDQPLFLLNLL